jgi:hypothetical protein
MYMPFLTHTLFEGIMKSLHWVVETEAGLPPLAVTGNTARTVTIDLQGSKSCLFIIYFGAFISGASVDVLIEESDASGSGFTTVGANDLLGTNGTDYVTGDANTTKKYSYIGAKRYVKITLTHSGNSSTGVLSSVVCVQEKASQPQA